MFRRIGTASTVKSAFLKGKFRVENTAGASLRITSLQSNTPVKFGGLGILGQVKFRQSTKETGVFIQKNKFRISTAGEKGDITQKGLLAIQLGKQKKSKGFNIFGG